MNPLDDADALDDMNEQFDDHDPLGSSLYFNQDPINGGGTFNLDGQNVARVTPDFINPGNFRIDSYLASNQTDMESLLEELDFNPDELDLQTSSMEQVLTDDDFIGNPISDTALWQEQTTGFTCAVLSERGVIEAYTGYPVSESELVYHATANGWLTDNGMSPIHVGRLLDMYDIPNHAVANASMEDIMSELAQGHRVIVGVNTDQLNNPDSQTGEFIAQAADHAVWVTGVDMSDPNNPQVIINDSGTPDGAGIVYDLNQFKDAWKSSGFFYVSTLEAPPGYELSAGTFDPVRGEISELVEFYDDTFGDFEDKIMSTDFIYDERPDSSANFSSTLSNLDDATVDNLFRLI